VKSPRLNPRKKRIVTVHAISGKEENLLCPLKLIIISAMRLGALDGPIGDVLAKMARRRDKTLQWKEGKGNNPVLCKFDKHGHGVNASVPATTLQMLDTVRGTSLMAGFITPLVAHDVRRGSAADMANLPRDPTAPSGIADRSVAAELGHSNQALAKGITAAYVGPRKEDTWTKRVKTRASDLFGVEIAQKPYSPLQWTHIELQQLYANAGIDPSNKNDKWKVRDRARKEHLRKWREGEKNATIPELAGDKRVDSRPGKVSQTLRGNFLKSP
jgi:hypothetical protein